MILERRRAIRVTRDGAEQFEDTVARERSFRLMINGEFFCRIIATEEYLRELGAGFVISEGLAEDLGEVEVKDGSIWVKAGLVAGVTCGIGTSGGMELERALPVVSAADARITPEEVRRCTSAIEADLWRQTGGVHCSVLCRDGAPLVRICDVGRHNTVDKAIGYALLRGIDLSGCVLGCTGRQPAGMVAKAARAGIPIVISRAASTDRGIETAEKAGITLICFSRGDRFTIYTHPERVTGLRGLPQA